MRTHRPQTLGEEIANAVTHGIGAGLSLAGLVLLVVLAAVNGTALHVVSLAIYGSTLVLLYGASTVYHSVQSPRAKTVLELLDHVAIYLLIAGTYTPFTLISLGGPWGWGLFVVIWSLAVAGALFRILSRHHGRRFSVPIYLAMGWLVLIAAGEVYAAMGPGGTFWLLLGGLLYSVGVIFYAWRRLPFHHAVWHVFVIGGSACHFAAVAVYVVPWS